MLYVNLSFSHRVEMFEEATPATSIQIDEMTSTNYEICTADFWFAFNLTRQNARFAYINVS